MWAPDDQLGARDLPLGWVAFESAAMTESRERGAAEDTLRRGRKKCRLCQETRRVCLRSGAITAPPRRHQLCFLRPLQDAPPDVGTTRRKARAQRCSGYAQLGLGGSGRRHRPRRDDSLARQH